MAPGLSRYAVRRRSSRDSSVAIFFWIACTSPARVSRRVFHSSRSVASQKATSGAGHASEPRKARH